MGMKLKSKIAWGGSFLFALLLLVGILSFYYFNRITSDAGEIIKDNYETLNYTKDMLGSLDKLKYGDSLKNMTDFEMNLAQQEKNITEPGEKELTNSLRKNFELFKKGNGSDTIDRALRNDINSIMLVNLQAIDKKNKTAQVSIENAKIVIVLVLTMCILIGLTFLYNFPSLVATPIAKLTDGIKAIAARNYGQRIHLNRSDEFEELAAAFNSMAEKLDEYEHSNLSKILFEKQRAETVINSLKDASIGIDTKGTILFANQQALQLLHLKEAAIVGLSQEEVQKKNDLFRFLLKEQDAIPFKIVVEGKENYFTKEQIEITQKDTRIGSVIVLRNITPFKELDTAKTNFIATISHELKTPLASADFSLKLLEDERVGTLTEEQKELVKNLKTDNQRLLRILSELLDLSQVDSGRIQLKTQTFKVQDLIQKAIGTIANAAKEKNITLIVQPVNEYLTINADEEKTVWVVNNLLSNAIRYSPENGEIIIKAETEESMVKISIQDFGIGIDPSYQQKIFDRFFRVPGTQKKGTGLGLAISKEFIEAMKGIIKLESEPGKGSTFSFYLPSVNQ